MDDLEEDKLLKEKMKKLSPPSEDGEDGGDFFSTLNGRPINSKASRMLTEEFPDEA